MSRILVSQRTIGIEASLIKDISGGGYFRPDCEQAVLDFFGSKGKLIVTAWVNRYKWKKDLRLAFSSNGHKLLLHPVRPNHGDRLNSGKMLL